MGMFDNFDGIQIKAGPCEMLHFDIGDKAPIADGVYVGYEGVVVIKGGVFVAAFDNLFDKWGDVVDTHEILNSLNPLSIVVKEVSEKHEHPNVPVSG